MKKIALYGCYSIDTGKDISLENQFRTCEDYAQAHYENFVITKYEDVGGESCYNRQSFKQLLDAAANGAFDVIICYSSNRITHELPVFKTVCESLHSHGAELVFIKENIKIDKNTTFDKKLF